jgi:ankyrin repeat protein
MVGVWLVYIPSASNHKIVSLAMQLPNESPLIVAIRQHDSAEVERLVNRGDEVNQRNNAGDTALVQAIKQHAKISKKVTQNKSQDNEMKQNSHIIQILIQHADMTYCSSTNTPPLIDAMAVNSLYVQQLLDAKADPNLNDRGGNMNPLTDATSFASQYIQPLLLAKADPNGGQGCSHHPLELAVDEHNTNQLKCCYVKMLLEAKANVNEPALTDGAPPLLQFLVATKGPEPNLDLAQLTLVGGRLLNSANSLI